MSKALADIHRIIIMHLMRNERINCFCTVRSSLQFPNHILQSRYISFRYCIQFRIYFGCSVFLTLSQVKYSKIKTSVYAYQTCHKIRLLQTSIPFAPIVNVKIVQQLSGLHNLMNNDILLSIP